MNKYKLHNTDGKTFFDFRSDPKSRGEGFTLSFLDDGTVVMSGDYGTLCWKRNYHHEGDKDFRRDYGFPNEETGISYFEEKVCQFGIPQIIRKWDREKAITDFKERYKGEESSTAQSYEEVLETIEGLEEYDETRFHEEVREFDCDAWEYNWTYYTKQFQFMFKLLQSVADQVWEASKK